MNNNSEEPIITRKKIIRALVINLILLTALMGFSLVFQYKSTTNQMRVSAIQIASQMDNFFQIGELYLSNYAHPDLINMPARQQYEQFERDLLPFPFFNQLSLLSSNGQIITGFPNDDPLSLSDELISYLINIPKTTPNFFITIKTSSQSADNDFVFIKAINNPENASPVYLIGETNWSSNPLNLFLRDSLQNLSQSNFSANIIDENNLLIISLITPLTDFSGMNRDMLKSSHPLRLNNWMIEISKPYRVFGLEVLKNASLYLLVVLGIGLLVSYAFISNRIEVKLSFPQSRILGHKESKQLEHLHKRNENNKTQSEYLDLIQDFISDSARFTNKNELCKLIIKYASKIPSSSIRIIIYNNPYLPSQGFFSIDSGDLSNSYAYLDSEILKQTRDGNKLFIPDIRKVQLIPLSSEKLYPLSIYVYPIYEEDLLLGVLWLGFELAYQITTDENKLIFELIKRASPQLSLAITSDVLKTIASEQDSILECLQLPVIILDEENKIIYINDFIVELERRFQNKIGFLLKDLDLDHSLKEIISDHKITEASEGEEFIKDNRIYKVFGFQKKIAKNRLMKIFIFREITAEVHFKDNLSNNISLLAHSMRSPLTNMKGYTNMLAMIGQVNDQQKEYIQKIITNIDETSNLVKNLLDIEKLEKGVNLQLQNIDCIEIIDKVVQSLKAFSNQKQIEIQNIYDDKQSLIVFADPLLLERALYNLVENAIRYSNRKSMVSIKVDRKNDYVEIIIKDNGIGIAPVDIDHIFEKFYRVKISSSLEGAGSGLGLYLVKSIINQHNGKIFVSSILGKGTEFRIELPNH